MSLHSEFAVRSVEPVYRLPAAPTLIQIIGINYVQIVSVKSNKIMRVSQ